MTLDEEALLSTITPFAAPTRARLETTSWFDSAHAHVEHSPIDEFLENLYSINRLYLQAESSGTYMPILGSLVFLGMVSAAEGYFRSILRRLILTDPLCASNAASRTVSYAAAVHHQPDLLPEALLEGVSLASAKSLVNEFKTLCSVSLAGGGGVPTSLESLFQNFEDICQVRHCGIHRFGKLGSQQALRLGLDSHVPLLEKPLKLSPAHLQDIAEALEALIKAVNSYTFFDMLKRSFNASPAGPDKIALYQKSWSLDWDTDEIRFTRFHSIFASVRPTAPSAPVENAYEAFLAYIRATEAKRAR
jgi:hypothetical protein